MPRVHRQGRAQVFGGRLETPPPSRRLAQAQFAPGCARSGRPRGAERLLGAVEVTGREQRVAEPHACRPVRRTEFEDPLETARRLVVGAAAGGEKAQVVRPFSDARIELRGPLVAAPGLVDIAVRLVEAAQGAHRGPARRVAFRGCHRVADRGGEAGVEVGKVGDAGDRFHGQRR